VTETRPLFFHHVPKTGGTALSEAIRSVVPAGMSVSGHNFFLTQQIIEALLAEGLSPSQFIHGHPDFGISLLLQGKVRTITLLRDPAQQLVSHYLAILRDPSNPLHGAARGLGFRKFFTIHKNLLTYQTNNLRMGIESTELGLAALTLIDSIAASLPSVFEYLEEMCLVGTLENIEEFLFLLTLEMGWAEIPKLERHNDAPADDQDQVPGLLAELAQLEADPELAVFFAIERTTYLKARSLQDRARQRLVARRLREASNPPITNFLAYSSEDGQITLGENFERAEMSQAEVPLWWTGDDRLSRIYARILGDRRKIVAEIRSWHFVRPDNIHVFVEGREIPRLAHMDPDSGGRLEVDLTNVPYSAATFVEVVLRIRWPGAPLPDTAPFYPRIAICNLRLA
jgi:hypothetical protein